MSSVLCSPCGCGALALQILRGILVECSLPPCGCGALALQTLRGILWRIWALMGQIPRDMCKKLGCTTPLGGRRGTIAPPRGGVVNPKPGTYI